MNELVTFNEKYNCGTTTSLDIAENFNRQHKTILAAINNLEVSSDFIEQNFLPYSYIAKNGKSNPAYEICRPARKRLFFLKKPKRKLAALSRRWCAQSCISCLLRLPTPPNHGKCQIPILCKFWTIGI